MSDAATNKFLDNLIKRLKSNTDFRSYLNTKPHAVLVSRKYLRKLGITEPTIDRIYSDIKAYVANVNKRGNGPAEFDEAKGYVYFLSPGSSDNFAKGSRVRRIVNAGASRDGLDLEFETGHTLTSNITEAAYQKIARSKAPVEIKESVFQIYNEAERVYQRNVAKVLREQGLEISIRSIKAHQKRKTKSQFLVILSPQTKDTNQKVIRAFENEFKKVLIDEIINLRSSPSYFEIVNKSLVDAFLGNKTKNQKYTSNAKTQIKPTGKSVDKLSPKIIDKRSTVEDLSVVRLQTLINLRLHDQIKINMGKGRSKNVLNYRTGRFAKSAEAQAVVQSRDQYLDVYYTYQRFPYDTFLPGGRLYKPGRDPRTIIGRSIRQLATEFVSNNFKVNPILKGGA